jgi:putative DNA primase/helicase
MFHDRLLHIHETGEWLRFDPASGWLAAPPGEVDRAAKQVLKELRERAAEQWKAKPDETATKRFMAHVERSSMAPRLRAMSDMAKSEPGMTRCLTEFDADPMLLGVTNGVLDLRSGKLLPVSPSVLVSKRANVPFDPGTDCPRFKRFTAEVQPDPKVRAFLRRFAGYCLTGEVGEQMFAFLYGLGANGKTVFIELLAWLLGDYSRKIATEMLMQHQRNPQGPSPDIVALKGIRLAYATETDEGVRLAEGRVKELTGGDSLTGRVPYGTSAVTFGPTHKLVILGNHKPEITDNSFGMWRRVLLTPFEQTIPEAERDPKLLEKLKDEGPGILNWMLKGLRSQQRHGLKVPDSIKASTQAYREDQDIIGEFIGDCCTTGSTCSVAKRDLYIEYQQWASANGHKPLAQGRLTRRLNERGYRLARDKRTVTGIALNSPSPPLWSNLGRP